jgi:GDP-mannose 6-dehydrogenase
VNVSVIGLGYVGIVAAACLAKTGHTVIGVDTDGGKIDRINLGQTPIVEAGLAALISQGVTNNQLTATTNTKGAILETQLSLVCVGTPSRSDGSLDLQYVEAVCRTIGEALREHPTFHVVVLRSTIIPGTMRELVIPTLERYSGKRAHVDFGVCFNPEFLREGTAVRDYYNPPKIVIGSNDERSSQLLKSLYQDLTAPLNICPLEVAEMVKYADNAFHAIKVNFANEIGSLCKSAGVDGRAVMDIFCQDELLNISSYYLRPGFSFGGSCLPKDIRALTYYGSSRGLSLPLLNSVLDSNQHHLDRAISLVEKQNSKKVGILGLSFKAGTDDTRESPMLSLVQSLQGRGYELHLFDSNVQQSSRHQVFPQGLNGHTHFRDSIDEVIADTDTLVIGYRDQSFVEALKKCNGRHRIVDLADIEDIRKSNQTSHYEGICWS